jgi:hypothetical protein
MNVIFDKEVAAELAQKYTVLPLPPITQTEDNKTVTVQPQVIIDMEKVPLQEISSLDQWVDLHKQLVENHIKKDYNFCEQAVEHLMGKFKGELDSYYKHILAEARISE